MTKYKNLCFCISCFVLNQTSSSGPTRTPVPAQFLWTLTVNMSAVFTGFTAAVGRFRRHEHEGHINNAELLWFVGWFLDFRTGSQSGSTEYSG